MQKVYHITLHLILLYFLFLVWCCILCTICNVCFCQAFFISNLSQIHGIIHGTKNQPFRHRHLQLKFLWFATTNRRAQRSWNLTRISGKQEPSPKKVPFMSFILLIQMMWKRNLPEMVGEMVTPFAGKKVENRKENPLPRLALVHLFLQLPSLKKAEDSPPEKIDCEIRALPSLLDPFALFSRDNDNSPTPNIIFVIFTVSFFRISWNHLFQVKWADVLLSKKKGSHPCFEYSQHKIHHFFVRKKIGRKLFINLRNLAVNEHPKFGTLANAYRSEIPLEWCKHFAKISLYCKRCTAPWPKWPANGPVRQTEGRQSQRVMTKEKHTTGSWWKLLGCF